MNNPMYYGKYNTGLIGDEKRYEYAIAIDVLNGTISVAHYKTGYGSHWENDESPAYNHDIYKLDDIEGISKDFYIKLYSKEGKIIK